MSLSRSGGKPAQRDTQNYATPRGPTDQMHQGPGLGGANLGKSGTQGPSGGSDGTSGSVGLGGTNHGTSGTQGRH